MLPRPAFRLPAGYAFILITGDVWELEMLTPSEVQGAEFMELRVLEPPLGAKYAVFRTVSGQTVAVARVNAQNEAVLR